MARPTLPLIDALRETARRLDDGAEYAWTHMGRCNCGHLAQTVTRMSPAEIHAHALDKDGDWTEQAAGHCADSGYSMDHIISALLDLGLTTGDVADLEKLRNDRVLRRIAAERGPLVHKRREDVALYMRVWADVLEEELETEVERNGMPSDPVDVARSGRIRGPVRVRF